MTCEYANTTTKKCEIEDYRYDLDSIEANIISQGLLPGCKKCDVVPEFMLKALEEHRRMKKQKEKDRIAEIKRQQELLKKAREEPLEISDYDISVTRSGYNITVTCSDRLMTEVHRRNLSEKQLYEIIGELIKENAIKYVAEAIWIRPDDIGFEEVEEVEDSDDVLWM